MRFQSVGGPGQQNLKADPPTDLQLDWPSYTDLECRFDDIWVMDSDSHADASATQRACQVIHRLTDLQLDACLPLVLPEATGKETRYR